MKTGEKTLAGTLVAVVAAGGLYKVAYPSFIKPLVDVSDKIVAANNQLEELEEQVSARYPAAERYDEYINRTAGTDPGRVANELQATLTSLIEDSGLLKPSVSAKKPARDKKTGLARVRIAVRAEGSLEDTATFLRRFYELPYVMRFNDLKIYPRGRQLGRRTQQQRINFSGTIEALVLPPDPFGLAGSNEPQQPVLLVKHRDEDYASISARQPFTWYVEPTPEPVEEEPAVVEQVPPDEQEERDPLRDVKRLTMVLQYGVDEVQVANTKNGSSEFVARGDKLDGGDLVLVHPYAVVVRKRKGDYLYQVGRLLSEGVPLEQAVEFPEVQYLMSRMPADRESRGEPPHGAEKGKTDDEQADGVPATSVGGAEGTAPDTGQGSTSEPGRVTAVNNP